MFRFGHFSGGEMGERGCVSCVSVGVGKVGLVMAKTYEPKLGETFLFCGDRMTLVGSNGSGSTWMLRNPSGQTLYCPSYGHSVTIEPLTSVRKLRPKTRAKRSARADECVCFASDFCETCAPDLFE